ncbi:MAG: hypothetical protein VW455_13790, partial [Nitrospinota bacterium]
WALIPAKGQGYKKRYWRGLSEVAQDIPNWIIFENILPVEPRKLPKPPLNPSSLKDKNPPKIPAASEVKERLDLLEQLRKENVITEEEYINKRKGILNQF